MKTRTSFFILSLAFILLSPTFLISQEFYDWGEKFPLTDSVSDNINADLRRIYSEVEGEMMIFTWEKSTDSNSSAIYFQNLLSAAEPQIVVSESGVHYTSPYILEIGSIDTLFYLFYQSDLSGNKDIYFMKYSEDGQFTGPFTFANTSGDEKEIREMYESGFYSSSDGRYVINKLVWTEEGKLMTCNMESVGYQIFFTEPVLLDSGKCSNLIISYNELIYYIREDDSGRFIYYIPIDYSSGNWGEPVLYFNGGNCYNLTQDKLMSTFLAWSADSNSVFRNYIASGSPPFDGYALVPEQDTPFDPGVCSIVIGVEPGEWFYDWYYMAFPFQDNGHNEIYMNDVWSSEPEFSNFSQSGSENRNPDFYNGEMYPLNWNCFYVYLVWEEFRNEHWQIFHSKTVMCVGGVEEDERSVDFIKTYPNPFTDELTVSYTLPSDESIKIEVFDLYGRKIKELYNGKQAAGEQQISWNGKDVPPGLYFIHLSSDRISSSKRVLKIN